MEEGLLYHQDEPLGRQLWPLPGGGALLMTHTMWDQPCPLGGPCEESPGLGPAVPHPGQKRAGEPQPELGRGLIEMGTLFPGPQTKFMLNTVTTWGILVT